MSTLHHLNCSTLDHSPVLIIPEPVDSGTLWILLFQANCLDSRKCGSPIKAVHIQSKPYGERGGQLIKLQVLYPRLMIVEWP